MAGKRTKKQKQKAIARREESSSYSINDIGTVSAEIKQSKEKTKPHVKKVQINSGFDSSYVFKDLAKTVVVTVVVVTVLVAYTILSP